MSESNDASGTSRWRRPRTWVILGVGVLGVWFAGSAVLTVHHARQANYALEAIVQNIALGDPQAADESIAEARSNTADVQAALATAPLAALSVVPYVATNFDGADDVMRAADDVLNAAAVTNQMYASLSGKDGSPAAFADGRINIEALESIAGQVDQIQADLAGAEEALADLPPDISPSLRRIADNAAAQIDGIQKGLDVYQQIRPELPKLLGKDQPARYLVVFHNPAELYAGGGAALSAAVVEFDDGRLNVVDKGAVSSHFFPGNPRVPWDPKAEGPYFETKGAKDGFAWSNLHQDYRVAGEDLMRSWVANGQEPVDGVISLDPAALAAVIRATGPVESPLYGQITADNLVTKLFYEGYNEDPAAQQLRHAVNQQLIDEMLVRLQDSSSALNIGRALMSTAPGHHLRVHLSDNRLAPALRTAELDGAQAPAAPDRIAFYTQNQNASKVDIFQARKVVHNVRLAADGSAEVTQTATVTNNAPENGSPADDREGYTTRWAFHWNIAFLPQKAKDFRIEASPGDIKTDNRVFTDLDGRKAIRIGRWIPAGGTSVITTTYRLPKGTFVENGNLVYRASVEHQVMVNGVELTVNVEGPSGPTPLRGVWTVDGNRATSDFVVDRPTMLAVGFGESS